jgi:serine/threonine protein kinase/Flp pilus assembly protein TadD
MNERPELLSIFCEARERRSAEERAEYLDEACGDDADLRARVEELLCAEPVVGNFLQGDSSQLQLAETIDEPITEHPGTVIGPYKLMEQIGEGGMGLVFVAEQQHPVRRKVALKVIKPGMDTRQVIARFEAERQALAIMDHPNIAKVLDGGATASGRPYFVMDLVKGMPITQFCDDNRLNPRERLELFLHVCEAVQHAHLKGIIHRDIKPSNVLVASHDGKPVVRVIDFGVAKAVGQQLTDKTMYTHLAQLIGTPLYMSPEQAGESSLDVDTRSDIYSLGVLLYELLTGTTPFDQERFKEAGYDEMRRIIREEEPPKPSTRISTLGQAAMTVSTQRKSDPKRLSQLFRGELDWIVMKALEKDRNRRYETASAFAADVQRYLQDEPVFACPPSAWYRFRKLARRNKTGLVIAGLILFFMVLLGGGAGWVVRDRAAQRAETTRQVQDLLTVARDMLGENQVARARQKLAEARSRIGDDRALLAGLADEVEALDAELDQFERYLELVDQAHEAEIPKAVPLALQSEAAGGTVVTPTLGNIQRDPARAIHYLLEALSCYGILEHDDWSARLEGGLLGPDQVTRVRRTAYEDLLWLANDLTHRHADHRSGRKLTPKEAAQKALPYLLIAESAFHPTTAFYQIRAACRKALGQEEEARKDLQAARQTPGTVALDHYVLAWAAYDAGNKAEAVKHCEAALRAEPTDYWSLLLLGDCLAPLVDQPEQNLRAAAAAYTGCILKRPEHATAYSHRGIAYHRLRRLNDAMADYREALRLQPDFPEAHANLGVALADQGKLVEAEVEFREALRLRPGFPEAHCCLGNTLIAQGNNAEAEAEQREALRLRPDFPEAHCGLGNALNNQAKRAEAEKECREALRLRPDFAEAHTNLGIALNGQGKHAEAEKEFREALRLRPELSLAHTGLGGALQGQGKYPEAEAEYREALRLRPNDPQAHSNLGNNLRLQGKLDEAEMECREALRLQPGYPEAHCNLGLVLQQQGHFAEALEAFKRGHEFGSKQPNWRYPSAEWVRQVEQLIALDAKLPKVLHRQVQPADAAERVALAWLCQEHKKRYAAAARFYAEAFADEPKLAEDLGTGHRYNAACAAALAGCRQGEDAAQLDNPERVRLRQQALDWLRADLKAWGQLLEKEPEKNRATVLNTLRHWRQDTDFAGVRGDSLAKLPEAERPSWRLLWEDVEQTLKKAGRGDTEEKKKEASK